MKISSFNLFASAIIMIAVSIPFILPIGGFNFGIFLCFTVVSVCLFRQLKGLSEGKNLASTIVLFGILLWYLYPALIYAVFNGGEEYTSIFNKRFELFQLNMSLFLIGIFICSFLIFSGFNREYSQVNKIRIYENTKNIPLLAIIAAIIGVTPILASGLSFEAISEALILGRNADKPWIHTENIGNETSGIKFLLTCSCWAGVMFLITYTMHAKDAGYKKAIIGIFAFFLFLFLSVDSGTRSLSMLALLPSICISLILISGKNKNTKLITFFVPISIIILALMQLQLFIRKGTFAGGGDIDLLSDLLLLGGSIDYFKETLYSVMLVPDLHDYFLEFNVFYFITFIIPRFIWPNKPVTNIVWFYTMERWGHDLFFDVGNIFPGLVGQYYMSFGVIGPVLIGGIFAYIAQVADKKIFLAKSSGALFSLAVYLMYAIWLFVSFRFFSPGFLFPVLIAHIILMITNRKYINVKRTV
jgi:oligosaccharide repeat unit polymerase